MIHSMPLYKRYSIVTVPFPFTDKNFTKKRPALVISQENYQKHTHHCILAMITSAQHSHWDNDVNIIALESAGLPGPSVLRFKLFTLDERLILRMLGQLAEEDQKNTQQVLSNIFNMD